MMQFLKEKRPDIFIFCVFLIFPLVLFFEPVFLGKALYYGDFRALCYPLRHITRQMLQTGQFILWNPYLFSGASYIGDISTALFYPFTLFYYFLDQVSATTIFTVFHLMLGSIFSFFYLRNLKLGKISSLVGALIFVYSSPFLLRTTSANILGTIIWFPLMLLFIDKATEENRLVNYIYVSLFFGISALNGFVQLLEYIAIAASLYLVFRAARYFKVWGPSRFLYHLICSFSSFLIGLGIAAIQFFPAVETLLHSPRMATTPQWAMPFSMSLHDYLTMFVPAFFDYQGGAYFEGVFYLGMAAIVFFAAGVLFARFEDISFFVFLGVLSFIASLGVNSPLHFILARIVPFYNFIQTPCRWVLILSFCASVVAAFGLEHLIQAEGPLSAKRTISRLASFIFVFALLLFFVIGGRFLPMFARWPWVLISDFLLIGLTLLLIYLLSLKRISAFVFAFITVLVILLDTYSYSGFVVRDLKDRFSIFAKPPYVDFLSRDKSYFRVLDDGTLGDRGIVWGLYNASGYNPSVTGYYLEYLWANDSFFPDPQMVIDTRIYHVKNVGSKMMGLLNVKYFILTEGVRGMETVLVGENKNFMPRAFVVPAYRVMENKYDIFGYMSSDSFDPRREVVLEEEPSTGKGLHGRGPVAANVDMDRYSPNEIILSSTSNADGFLVLSEAYFPGWKAYVDGREEKIYKAYYVLRSIVLEKGAHKIRFVYDPPSFKIGKYVSLLSLVICLGLIGYDFAAKRRAGNETR